MREPSPPAVDATTAPTVDQRAAFLYTGSEPVQRDVDPSAVEARRVSLLNGVVRAADDSPLEGVLVYLPDQPKLGYTVSRTDGRWDLAVNAGGEVTVAFEKEGYLTAQRKRDLPWGAEVTYPTVRLLTADSQSTTVEFGTASPQVARSSQQTDDDGTRRSLLYVPSGTAARWTDGSGAPGSLTIRMTEFTVGDGGPESMPSRLPPTSGYTYAAEFGVDETPDGGGTSGTRPFVATAEGGNVDFDRPLVNYVDNFLGFDVGEPVPTGFYDRERGRWLASDDGRVVAVLDTSGGVADLDVDGSGTGADDITLAALGITDEERGVLAEEYTPGDILWRVPIPHFSPWDHNWPFGPPDGASAPDVSRAKRNGTPTDDPDPCNE